MRRLLYVLSVLAVFFVAMLAPRAALAHMGKERPTALGPQRPSKPADGERGRAGLVEAGPIVLAPSPRGMSGTFRVKNVGSGPLRVFGVEPLSDEGGPRFPPGVGVHTTDVETNPLAPGAERTFIVEWATDATLARQGAGVFVVESDSAGAGATEFDPDLRVEVRFDRRPAWMRWLPALSLLFPALLAACSLLSFRVRRVNDRQVLGLALSVAVAALVVDAALVATMNRTLGRADGGFGLQHVHHGTAFGVDVLLGLDGLSAPLLLSTSALLLVGLAALPSGPTPRVALVTWYGVLAAAVKLFVLSQSLVVSTAAIALAAVVTLALLASIARAEPAARRSATLLAAVVAVGAVAFAVFAHLVVRDARAAHAELGPEGAHLTELARLALHAHEEGPAPSSAAPAWVLVALALSLGVAPAVLSLGHAMRPALAPLAGFFAALGAVMLVRCTVTLFPSEEGLFEGLAWLGALLALAGVAWGLAARRLDGLVGGAAAVGAGIALLAWSSTTMQGFQAAVVILAVRTVAVPLALLSGAAVVHRTGEPSPSAHAGLASKAPRLSIAWCWALASSAAVPGGAATIGWFLAALGVVGRSPAAALIVVVAGLGAAALLFRAFRMVAGDAPAWWRSSVRLEAHGGAPPDLRGAEVAWVVLSMAALVVMLIGSRYWFGSTGRTLLDVFRALAPAGPTQVS